MKTNQQDIFLYAADHIPKEIKKLTGNKNITTNIYMVQESDSIICEYFRIGTIEFMVKGNSFLDYNNLFT